MTANESTHSDGQECTDDEQLHLFDRESAYGAVMGETFIEPEKAAVEVKPLEDDMVMDIRHAVNSRCINLRWILSREDARGLVEDLEDTLDEIESEE